MNNQPNQPTKKLALKKQSIHILTTQPSGAQCGPTAIDCSVTC